MPAGPPRAAPLDAVSAGRPDDSAGTAPEATTAERAGIRPDEADAAARRYWEAAADAYQAEHGAFLTGPLRAATSGAAGSGPLGARSDGTAFVWGPEGLTEDEAGLLGPIDDLAGRRVLEVGCGAAQCSAWLAERGVHAVGIDIAVAQLRHGTRALAQAQDRRPAPAAPISQPGEPVPIEEHPTTRSVEGQVEVAASAEPGAASSAGSVRVVAASATALPFGDAAFDAAFASYGAVQFVADLPRLLGEVRRVLRPGARWVFSVTHPVRWAFPDEPGPEGLAVAGSYFDRTPYVERAGGTAVYAEFHRTIGDYVTALRAAGFAIEAMVEPEWPDWNESTWGGWSPLRGAHLPGTLILGCRAGGAAA